MSDYRALDYVRCRLFLESRTTADEQVKNIKAFVENWPALVLASDTQNFIDHKRAVIINKALEKDRVLRYQGAGEIRYPRPQPASGGSIRCRASAVEGRRGDGAAAGVRRWGDTHSSAIAAAKRHKFGVAGAVIVAVVVLAAAAIGVYSLLQRKPPMPFQNFTVTQMTNSGKAALAAISPDGRYMVSVMQDGGLQSVWLRNVPTSSDTQIIPPSGDHYASLVFSPDGNNIYFRKANSAALTGYDLYRVPVLGGAVQKLVSDIDSNVTFSPDGRRIAYARANDPEIGKYNLLTAGNDGSNEKAALIAPASEMLPSVAWSPQGTGVAGTQLNSGASLGRIVIADVDNGHTRRLGEFQDKMPLDLAWSPDGRGIFMAYAPRGSNFIRRQGSQWIFGGQIGFVSSSGGDFESITRDTNRYASLTVSSDGRTLATVQTKSSNNAYVVEAANPAHAQPVSVQARDLLGVAWSADGKLLVTDGAQLWKTDPDGKNPLQLVSDTQAVITFPAACGRYVVFGWRFHEQTNAVNVWRTNADGSNPTKLTSGGLDLLAVCSPDQKWVYYQDRQADQIWRVALDGSGKPERLPAGNNFHGFLDASEMSVSPDSKTLAYTVDVIDPQTQLAVNKVAMLQLEPPQSLRMLDVNHHITGPVQFLPDGHAIAYPVRENGVDNLWVQSLDGSPGHALTRFTSEQIGSFRWSPDGKSFAIIRGHAESDVVLLQASKP